MKKNLVAYGLFCALGEIVYVLLVALFISNAGKIFGPDEPPKITAFASLLMVIVLSAAISGTLVLGKPILLYLEGKKKEALQLFGITLGWLFVLLIILVIATIIIK